MIYSVKTVTGISIKQLVNEGVITCGSDTRIQLQDSNGSSNKGIRDIDRALKDSKKKIKSLGK